MLRVIYAVADPGQGGTTSWREDRGLVEICVAPGTRAPQYTRSLNETLQDFLANSRWYQIWNGEIRSADSPGSPLRVEFEPGIRPLDQPVEIRESRGRVVIRVDQRTTPEQFVHALNPAIEEFLAGGRWFQLWQGEIVTMDSPEFMAA